MYVNLLLGRISAAKLYTQISWDYDRADLNCLNDKLSSFDYNSLPSSVEDAVIGWQEAFLTSCASKLILFPKRAVMSEPPPSHGFQAFGSTLVCAEIVFSEGPEVRTPPSQWSTKRSDSSLCLSCDILKSSIFGYEDATNRACSICFFL